MRRTITMHACLLFTMPALAACHHPSVSPPSPAKTLPSNTIAALESAHEDVEASVHFERGGSYILNVSCTGDGKAVVAAPQALPNGKLNMECPSRQASPPFTISPGKTSTIRISDISGGAHVTVRVERINT